MFKYRRHLFTTIKHLVSSGNYGAQEKMAQENSAHEKRAQEKRAQENEHKYSKIGKKFHSAKLNFKNYSQKFFLFLTSNIKTIMNEVYASKRCLLKQSNQTLIPFYLYKNTLKTTQQNLTCCNVLCCYIIYVCLFLKCALFPRFFLCPIFPTFVNVTSYTVVRLNVPGGGGGILVAIKNHN